MRAILDWRFKGWGGREQFWIGDLRVGESRAISDWRHKGGVSGAILDWRFKGLGGGAGQFRIGDLRVGVGSKAILDRRGKGGGEQANFGLEI